MATIKLALWLEDRLRSGHLSLRQAAAKTGLSHATIADILNGQRPYPETVMKLARAFGGDGQQRLALEDHLLVLAGYRTERHEEELSESMAELMDRVRKFDEPQLKIMVRFADFLIEIESKQKVALEKGLGAWKNKNHPDLVTPEDSTAHVRSIRKR